MSKTEKGGRHRDGGARLVFVDSDALTIKRRRRGRYWQYFDGDGARITDRVEIDRLNAIALPPAYREARFCPDPRGHLQAFGLDARGRRQYRYHPDYRAGQEAEKFSRCCSFAKALPDMRKAVERDLAADPTGREAVIAAIVQLLDKAYLRVGNEVYRKANKSFGVTTLHNRHAKLQGRTLHLRYRGKSGIEKQVKLTDRSLARIVRSCQDLPGQRLFQYEDERGDIRPVNSEDVNAYLREVSGADFTAKHFRTWHASVIAYAALRDGQALKEIIDEVSTALGNTPAVARKAYIHPKLIEAAATSEPLATQAMRATRWLSRDEREFIRWLCG